MLVVRPKFGVGKRLGINLQNVESWEANLQKREKEKGNHYVVTVNFVSGRSETYSSDEITTEAYNHFLSDSQ
jgi:hypothetical protein